jgi:hypothetical protein
MSRVLKVLTNLAAGKLERNLTCEACGKEFVCGASLKGCWCSEVKLTDENRTAIRQTYSDCLCRECLEQAGNIKSNAKQGQDDKISGLI